MTYGTLVEVVIVALIAYRLWRIAGRDTITEPIRKHLEGMWGGWVLEGVTCAWCLGFWLSLAVAYFSDMVGLIHHPLAVGLAASTLVGFLGGRDD